MTEGITCYERDEDLCEDQMCLRAGCRLRNEKLGKAVTYDQWKTRDPNEPFTDRTSTLDAFLHRIEVDIDRISSIWEDERVRINIRYEWPELAAAIDKLLGEDDGHE